MEVCVDNIQSALNAEASGALRIELCSALSEGGLTPSIGLFKTLKDLISIPIFVMLRPRCGMDFVYSKAEVQSMKFDAMEFSKAGADGFVFGILNSDGTVDCQGCSEILKIIKPFGCSVTFHRAFDVLIDPFQSLNQIICLGFDRILTSGQKKSAVEGSEMLRQLIILANDKILIMPGAGVNEKNALDILVATGAKELHGSARRSVRIQFQGGPEGTLSSTDCDNEIFITDKDIVRQIVAIVNQFNS